MRTASWVSAATAVLLGATAAAAWRKANLADQARREAEAALDAVLEQLEAMTRIAQAAQQALPRPLEVEFDVQRIRGPVDRFRLHNVGTGIATNLRFVVDPAEEQNRRVPTPQWLTDDAVTLLPKEWADFSASALSPVAGSWRIVFPTFVTVIHDEAGTPRRVDLPTAVASEDGVIG
ncbi:hypothetical protein JWS13_43685 [Rhodococcus pseudokoreensis]|uniref:Uncharacterized protein n=1 Tax=Rhodococcus pseudokoreensis TaxID=2811421 RepID=A0A974WC55_9NOCA|nr:hypothetical protein [Rhodococcus pseudokoreensis]QSE95025.1 hypothetical protein JWS13_43685 [Rhodococcus pseudokoreensis]